MKTKIALVIAVIILLAGSIFFAMKYFSAKKEINRLQQEVSRSSVNTNGETLAFGQLFIRDVLEADSEVDFDTRLELENAVRNLNDEEILNQWKLFVASQDEASAQKEVRNLLKLLMVKIGNEK